jgi:chorismate mutase/prephenate dehydratase
MQIPPRIGLFRTLDGGTRITYPALFVTPAGRSSRKRPAAMSLDELRKQIDALDEQIVQLLNQRAKIVVEIGKIKAALGTPIYAPDRERAVLDKVRKANCGPLPASTIEAIYRELMSGSFALEKPLRIAFLGPEGSYSHLAALGKFGSSVEYEAVVDIRGVFEEITRGHADFGIVPIENSTGGGVIDTLDALMDTDVKVCAEINRFIHHNLLANCPLEEIERVYSKPEVFAQCQRWLSDTQLVGKTIPVASTSKAAEMAKKEAGSGAIGSSLAGELYELKVVCENIEDNPRNMTRFFVIGKESSKPTGDDKTSVLFITADKPGALVDVLDAFRSEDVNLSFIQSRPSKKRNWEYYFFADAKGHAQDENMKRALARAKDHCLRLNVLGSYPQAQEAT